jgi:hypothetical protein
MNSLLERYDSLRLVWRHFPNSELHPGADLAGHWSELAELIPGLYRRSGPVRESDDNRREDASSHHSGPNVAGAIDGPTLLVRRLEPAEIGP